MLYVTLGNAAPLEPNGVPAEVGATTTTFEIPHDDTRIALREIRDAWPRHSAEPPVWVSGDLAVEVGAEFNCEVRGV
jgi:hypothetical protein